MRHDEMQTDDRVTEQYDEELDVATEEFYTFGVPEAEMREAAEKHHPALEDQ